MEVVYKKRFEKNFKKLPLKIREQFYDRLRIFLADKLNRVLNNHSVSRVFPNCRSINVTGDYRAVFKEEGKRMVFITIGRHAELYQ